MKYQNLWARGYIVQGARLFVTEFQHIYIWVGLFFLFVFSFSGGGNQNGFEELAEKNGQSQGEAFIQGLLGIKDQTIKSGNIDGGNTGSITETGSTTGNINLAGETNVDTDESTPRGMIGFVAGFVFVFLSVFVLIGWWLGLVWGGWFTHLVYNRMIGKPVSQGGSLLLVMNHSLTILKTDAKRLLIGYRPSLVILVILMIIGGYGYLQDWSEVTWGFYIITCLFLLFVGVIYGIYKSSLKYGFTKIASFVHLDKQSNNYFELSERLTKNRKRNLFGNLLFLGSVSTFVSLLTLSIQLFAPIASNRSIAIATCITTISTCILLIASVVMFREFELSST